MAHPEASAKDHPVMALASSVVPQKSTLVFVKEIRQSAPFLNASKVLMTSAPAGSAASKTAVVAEMSGIKAIEAK